MAHRFSREFALFNAVFDFAFLLGSNAKRVIKRDI